MKCPVAMVVLLAVAVCLCLGLMHLRSQERLGEAKRHKFTDIKLSVTDDVLEEFREAMRRVAAELTRSRDELPRLEAEVGRLEDERKSRLDPLELCKGEKKQLNDRRAAVESETDLIQSDFQEQKSAWEAEKLSLTEQRQQQSHLCDYANHRKLEVRILCGLGNPPKQQQAEQPEEHESKPKAPKKEEEAKEEPPKAGDPQKADANEPAPKAGDPQKADANEPAPKAGDPQKADANEPAPRGPPEDPQKADANEPAPRGPPGDPQKADANEPAPKKAEVKQEEPKKEDM